MVEGEGVGRLNRGGWLDGLSSYLVVSDIGRV